MMNRRSAYSRFRRGHSRGNTRLSRTVDFISLSVVVALSFVLLIPFYIAAGSMGEGAILIMLLVNAGLALLGYRLLARRWPSFKADLKGSGDQPGKSRTMTPTRIPPVSNDD